MAYMSSLIVVGMYFSRKRAIATGIATSGSGLGTFAYAYMTNVLLDTYDWKGTVLILSAILLHIVACGAIYRPLLASDKASEQSSFETVPGTVDELEKLLPVPNDIAADQNMSKLDRVNFLKKSELHVPQRMYVSSGDVTTSQNKIEYSKQFSSHRDFRDLDLDIENARHRHSSHHSSRNLLRPLSRKDIFYSGSLARLPQANDNNEMRDTGFSELKDSSEVENETKCVRMKKTLISYVSMFKEKIFILLLLANVFWTGMTHSLF